MEKLHILGTGCAMVTKCYNTCLTLTDGDEHFLIDTGGGNTILANLEKCSIPINKIHHLFISHSHNDHITGVVWIVRAVAQSIINNKYDGTLTIYGHNEVLSIADTICRLLLQPKFYKYIGERILFSPVEDKLSMNILGRAITFFDNRSKKQLQYGFKILLKNGKVLTFLGDEPYREELKEYAEGADYLLHEAYCLYAHRDIFHPYEKFHSTVKDACINAAQLDVKNVLLYHTEDKNILNRKELYINEGKEYFLGNILVPDDLETIML